MSTVDGDARGDAPASGRWDDARTPCTEVARADEHPVPRTVPAYEHLP